MGTFSFRYSTVTNGAITFTGNTVGLSKKEESNDAGTEHSIGAYISTDPTLNYDSYATTSSNPTNNNSGSTLAITENGSFSYLNIPTNSTILYADLIWAGSYISGSEDNSNLIQSAVNVSINDGTPLPILPDITYTDTGNPAYYMNVTKITSTNWPALLAITGGSFKIACENVVGTTNPDDETNNACGWTLCIVYSNPTLPSRNLTLYSGNTSTFVASGDTVTATASGFETPTSGIVNGRIPLTALEGDAVLTGDQASISDNTGTFHTLVGPNNLANNFFASQINNNAGFVDTSGSFGNYNQNPDGTNIVGGRQGWDITNVNANPFPFINLNNGQTSTTVQCTSKGDRYWVTGLGIQIDINAPLLHIVKSTPNTLVALNEVINYEIRITNEGTANAYNLVFDDDVPPNTVYVPNSVSVTGASANTSLFPTKITINSSLSPGSQPIIIRYSVRVINLPPSRTIVNFSDITYDFDGPDGKPLTGNSESNSVVTALASPLPPVVQSSTVNTCKNKQVSGTVNAVDIDALYPLQYLIFTNPTHGFAAIDINTGFWHYTPFAGFVGVDSFTIKVLDSQGATSYATITINVLDVPCCELNSCNCTCKNN